MERGPRVRRPAPRDHDRGGSDDARGLPDLRRPADGRASAAVVEPDPSRSRHPLRAGSRRAVGRRADRLRPARGARRHPPSVPAVPGRRRLGGHRRAHRSRIEPGPGRLEPGAGGSAPRVHLRARALRTAGDLGPRDRPTGRSRRRSSRRGDPARLVARRVGVARPAGARRTRSARPRGPRRGRSDDRRRHRRGAPRGGRATRRHRLAVDERQRASAADRDRGRAQRDRTAGRARSPRTSLRPDLVRQPARAADPGVRRHAGGRRAVPHDRQRARRA